MKEQYTTVEETVRMPEVGNHHQPRKMTVKFPCLIKQVDRDTVEIEMQRGPDPFNEEFTKAIATLMGDYRGEQFLDDMADYIAKQSILRNIR